MPAADLRDRVARRSYEFAARVQPVETRVKAMVLAAAGAPPAFVRGHLECAHADRRTSGRPTIFLVVRPGPAARFALHTEILPTLCAADVSLCVLTPPEDMPVIAESLEGTDVMILPLRRQGLEGPPGVARLRVVLQRARRAALDGRKSARFDEKHRARIGAWSEREPKLAAVVDAVVRFGLWRSPTLRKLLVRAAVRLAPPLHADLFERYRPDLVVCTGLGYAPWDEGILQEASARGVKTAALVHNWDNPSTGGYRAAPLDLVIAWSESMSRQLVEMQDVQPSRIRVAGVPHWDAYVRDGGVLTKGELFGQLGLDPSRPLILHATHRPRKEVDVGELVEDLVSAVRDGSFGDAQLVVRLHPKFMAPEHRSERERLADLARGVPGVRFNQPAMISAGQQEIDPSDTRLLGSLIKHCDVLVNVFSTTTLEAFLLDRPVVIADPKLAGAAAITTGEPLAWRDYSHLQSILTRGAVPVAESSAELRRQVRSCLADPTHGRDLRREIAREECGPADGLAGRRTALYLCEAAQRQL